MGYLELFKNIFLFCVLGVCAMTDIRERKIRNRWIAAGLIGVFVYWLVLIDGQVVWNSFLMFVIFAVVLFPLYLLKVLGAGDVKLLCMTALYIGNQNIKVFLMACMLCSGIMACVKMLFYKNFKKRIIYFWLYMRRAWMTGSVEEYGMPEQKTEVIGLAVPVLFGVIVWAFSVYIMT